MITTFTTSQNWKNESIDVGEPTWCNDLFVCLFFFFGFLAKFRQMANVFQIGEILGFVVF
jgi:hypothetical protein